MALTVGKVITDRVRKLLRDIDDGGIQWLDDELIDWLNEACAEIARIRPEASSQTINQSLNAGSLQTIPEGATLLLEAVCNVVLPSGDEGRIVRRVERNTLDNENLGWMTSTPSDVVKRYVVSQTNPRTYYVYPPHTGVSTSGLRLIVGSAPSVVSNLTSDLPLPDIYAAPIANYILYRAFGKLIEDDDAQNRSVQFLNIFDAQMGVTDRNQETRSAKTRHKT